MNVVSAVEGETLSPPAVTVMDWIPAAAFAAAAAAASFLFLSWANSWARPRPKVGAGGQLSGGFMGATPAGPGGAAAPPPLAWAAAWAAVASRLAAKQSVEQDEKKNVQ